MSELKDKSLGPGKKFQKENLEKIVTLKFAQDTVKKLQQIQKNLKNQIIKLSPVMLKE